MQGWLLGALEGAQDFHVEQEPLAMQVATTQRLLLALLAGDLLSDTQCLALRQRLLTGSEIDSSAAPGSDGLMLNWMDRTRGAQAVFKVC